MSARKLGRFACLVFVLAAVFGGGVGAADLTAKSTGAVSAAQSAAPAPLSDIIWE